MVDYELELIMTDGEVIMTDSEMTVTKNEEDDFTVIESSEGASWDHSSTSRGTDSSAVKSCRSVAWRYFDKGSDNRNKCTLCGKILKDCGNKLIYSR